jgi:hypothetical protein
MKENKYYYKDGTSSSGLCSMPLHRTDGPAIEYYNGTKIWYVDGKLHRTDGPALEHSNGNKQWYVDDEDYTEKEFNRLIEEIRQLPLALRLIDPREWVRKL